ncbi:molybdopterin molybdotransferase [Microbacterium halimionae]|uniref:Molybdopterin molybdenumtransferase n=1 Tax=Microbacterium halimionae TaxID=1526413 RepID=A0A7W3JM81_9MICO|nr:gephyrin-like molybdotransferase Glp [Microbacterium halimionae]MBA8815435.1 molybdopterin molybdotransferase [Microbacterium halimionae]NII95482.1 molybdopterin molybdotransferase [Microbacterium halimionae]
MNEMLDVEDHLASILAAVRLVETEKVSLDLAAGRTLREPVRAAVDIPVFDNSAMDGFAVRWSDVARASADHPVRLQVVADLPAGSDLDPRLRDGEAARIMTGSALPTDADAIVPFEETTGGLDDSLGEIEVLAAPARRGAHVRLRAGDAHSGDEVMPAGIEVGALQAAAAAAAGVPELVVSRRPRVAVISTGSELVSPGEPLRRGQIPESNSTLLAALAADAGADLVLRTSVPDDDESLRRALTDATARGADAVIFSGGVSAGAYEVVKTALGPGGEMSFSKVKMQPGKPQGFGQLASGVLLFGLPGNPVSSAVSFEVFVRPALLAMQGRTELQRPVLRMQTSAAWRTPPGRRQYLPVVIDRTDPAGWTVAPATSGASHLAGGLARAEAYAVVAAEVAEVAVGTFVNVMLVS